MFDRALIDWRVDPDHRQDRKCGPVITRKMTEEEIKKYGPPVQKKKARISVLYLTRSRPPKLKITDEQLMAEIKEYGTDKEACKIIAEKYGYSSWWVVQKRIKRLEGKKC